MASLFISQCRHDQIPIKQPEEEEDQASNDKKTPRGGEGDGKKKPEGSSGDKKEEEPEEEEEIVRVGRSCQHATPDVGRQLLFDLYA